MPFWSGGDKDIAKDYQTVLPLLEEMRALAEKLMRNKQRQGSLDFEFPSPPLR